MKYKNRLFKHKKDESNFVFMIVVHRTSAFDYITKSVGYIRKVYPDSIIYVIDDKSPIPVTKSDIPGVHIITSEFKGAGEVLPYYYFWKQNLGTKMIMFHDSIFVYDKIPLESTVAFKQLFSAQHTWDRGTYSEIVRLLSNMKRSDELLKRYNNNKEWNVVFGVMGICTWDFLNKIEKDFDAMTILSTHVSTRKHRMAVERVMGVLASFYVSENESSIFGDIHKYGWGLTYQQLINKEKNNKSRRLEKVWSGR